MNEIHEHIEDWMATSLAGGLSPSEKAELEKHLAFCGECQKNWKEEQMLNHLLDSTLAKQRPEGNFEDRIVRGFRVAARTSPKSIFEPLFKFFSYLRTKPILAIGLFTFLLVLSGLLIRPPALSRARESLALGQFQTRMMDEKSSRDLSALGAKQKAGSNLDGVLPQSAVVAGSSSSVETDSVKEAAEKASGLEERISGLETKLKDAGVGGVKGSGIKVSGYADTSYLVSMQNRIAAADAYDSSGKTIHSSALPAKTEEETKDEHPQAARKTLARKEVAEKKGAIEEASAAAPTQISLVDMRKLIRNATMEFEVQSYDASLEKIMKLAFEEKGYVATTDSSRLPNGKVRGQVIVKVLPENLESLILKLRDLGDLKNQAITTQDVTKAYFDTDARIRNGKLMEERLIKLLDDAKGKVTDLLAVEKELARVRESIEQLQGELKLYDSLIQYATITLTLYEKDLNEAAGFLLKEQASLSVFSPDVEKTFRDARKEAEDLKAQILHSKLERQADGPVSATLSVLVSPEQSDALLQQFRALGRASNLTWSNQRVAQGGTEPSDNATVRRDRVEINLAILYDDGAVTQHTTLVVLVKKAEEMAEKTKKIALNIGADIRSSDFQHSPDGQEQANFVFRVPVKLHKTFVEQLQELGKVREYSHTRQEGPSEGDKAADAPVEITMSLINQGDLVPEDHGFLSTLRKTFSEGTQALLGSIQSIIVGIAYILPWILGFGLIAWLLYILKNRIRKS